MNEVNLEQLADATRLRELVVKRGLISDKEYQLVEQQSQATGLAPWRVMLSLNLVTIEQLNSLASVGSDNGEKAAASPKAKKSDAATPADLPGLVEQIFHRAIDARATDIHFDPQDDGRMRVRYRVDGHLHDALQLPQHQAMSVVSRVKILATMDIIEKRKSQDGHIVFKGESGDRNMRVATVPTSRGERLVLRILDESRVMVGLERLGLDSDQLASVERLITKPYGIVAVTGPVGSGKTTTLYSCLNKLDDPHKNLMTIEDPVEYSLDGVNQLQVDSKIDWTFPHALRAMLRQDPDVIMVGEIRDTETARIAIRASLTGVLVLTTMHANDAASTVNTFYNYGIPGYLISTSLLGVIAQRLVRKINPDAYEEFEPDEHLFGLMRLDPANHPGLKLRRGKGTEEDFNTGYRGRTGIYEVMEINDLLRDMIFRETTKDVVREVAYDEGMTSLFDHGIKKVLEGITTVEEVYRVAVS